MGASTLLLRRLRDRIANAPPPPRADRTDWFVSIFFTACMVLLWAMLIIPVGWPW